MINALWGLALLFVVAGAAVTGVATFGSSCDLNSLQQVEIGSNTFIYAADNSRLGVIPAERNREPVTTSASPDTSGSTSRGSRRSVTSSTSSTRPSGSTSARPR